MEPFIIELPHGEWLRMFENRTHQPIKELMKSLSEIATMDNVRIQLTEDRRVVSELMFDRKTRQWNEVATVR